MACTVQAPSRTWEGVSRAGAGADMWVAGAKATAAAAAAEGLVTVTAPLSRQPLPAQHTGERRHKVRSVIVTWVLHLSRGWHSAALTRPLMILPSTETVLLMKSRDRCDWIKLKGPTSTATREAFHDGHRLCTPARLLPLLPALSLPMPVPRAVKHRGQLLGFYMAERVAQISLADWRVAIVMVFGIALDTDCEQNPGKPFSLVRWQAFHSATHGDVPDAL